jgi:hypothetical protein
MGMAKGFAEEDFFGGMLLTDREVLGEVARNGEGRRLG